MPENTTPNTTPPTPEPTVSESAGVPIEPMAEWLEEFFALPFEEMPGWFGDVMDTGIEVRPFDGGIAVHFADPETFDIDPEPTMRLYGSKRQTLHILLTYLFNTYAVMTLNWIAEENPAIVVKQKFTWRAPLDLMYKRAHVDEIERRGEAAKIAPTGFGTETSDAS